MSMGYLLGPSAPLVWRGLMVMKALQQLLFEIDWGGLDALVLDLPPGTGDTQLTITQSLILDGALVVTTPHVLAVQDAVRGLRMFETVGVPLLGLVQNMAAFRCPCCGGTSHPFGGGDAVRAACVEHGVEILADVPLTPRIADDAHDGRPTVVAAPESEEAAVFLRLAEKVARIVGL
jgi:ATP-binding protein involved in chromosome partitioning